MSNKLKTNQLSILVTLPLASKVAVPSSSILTMLYSLAQNFLTTPPCSNTIKKSLSTLGAGSGMEKRIILDSEMHCFVTSHLFSYVFGNLDPLSVNF